VVLNATIKFCQYEGVGCCDAAADAALQEQFDAMGVKPDVACGRIVKSILCSVSTLPVAHSIALLFLQSYRARNLMVMLVFTLV
jgi:hypothetical protein